ncbi:hypothetical protein AB1K70_16975 [Bremerella sp. JC770]|uniref:hypothetical protein n=1 Tax=Bremerella sp. JC770 TaxID=3232137 RepID=UPI00345972CE
MTNGNGEGGLDPLSQIPDPGNPSDEATREALRAEAEMSTAAHGKLASLQHIESLKGRIKKLDKEVLHYRGKLNSSETQVKELLPQVAELKQAKRGVTLEAIISTALIVIGGVALAISGIMCSMLDTKVKMNWYFILAVFLLGCILQLIGLGVHVASAIFGWPPEKPQSS